MFEIDNKFRWRKAFWWKLQWFNRRVSHLRLNLIKNSERHFMSNSNVNILLAKVSVLINFYLTRFWFPLSFLLSTWFIVSSPVFSTTLHAPDHTFLLSQTRGVNETYLIYSSFRRVDKVDPFLYPLDRMPQKFGLRILMLWCAETGRCQVCTQWASFHSFKAIHDTFFFIHNLYLQQSIYCYSLSWNWDLLLLRS